MTDETIVAIFDTATHADAAVRDLHAANVPSDAISQHANPAPATGSGTTSMPTQERGFWSSLFGGEPDHDANVYGRSVAGGSTVVTVRAPAQYVASVCDILDRHGPVDIDQRASAYGLTDTAATRPAVAMPVASKPPPAGPPRKEPKVGA